MFGKKKQTYNNNQTRFSESEYVDMVFKLTGCIMNTMDSSELYETGQRLNSTIQAAISSQIPRRDLITIEQRLSQSAYISDWSSQQNAGQDPLLQQRINILTNAYHNLSSSF